MSITLGVSVPSAMLVCLVVIMLIRRYVHQRRLDSAWIAFWPDLRLHPSFVSTLQVYKKKTVLPQPAVQKAPEKCFVDENLSHGRQYSIYKLN